MTAMAIEKFETLVDPRIEPGLNVTGDFAHDVLAILEPLQLAARRRGPDRFFAFLALITESHVASVPCREKRPSRIAITSLRRLPSTEKRTPHRSMRVRFIGVFGRP